MKRNKTNLREALPGLVGLVTAASRARQAPTLARRLYVDVVEPVAAQMLRKAEVVSPLEINKQARDDEYQELLPTKQNVGKVTIYGKGLTPQEREKIKEEKESKMARSATYQLVRRVLEEGRGRPRKHPPKPVGDEDMEGLEPDSGREADQHIHVRLKAVADSSEKGGANITFNDKKTHFVKQGVAKTVLSALEKMKPEARDQVHDHIVQSHQNLMQVHSMLTGKKQ